MEDLKKVVKELIALKKEGDYWDFKLEAYTKEKNQDFVHDVLCLSNSAHKGNRYLILGVSDDYEIIGVDHDTNRKKQEGYIAILRECDFAGDYRPEITLHSLEISNQTVEVIEIEDTSYKPYYLKKKYNKIKPYHIYTRICDTNTPIDKSADLNKVEKMWRQRFGIDVKPLDRLKKLLLEPENWVKNFGNKEYGYHKIFPEFNFKYIIQHENNDAFKYLFLDDYISNIGEITFYYHTTILCELEIAILDGCHIYSPVPEICTDLGNSFFYYFTKDNLNGNLLKFMTSEYSLRGRMNKPIPIPVFENDNERIQFLGSINDEELNDNNFNFNKYITKKKLEDAENATGASVKETIKIYDIKQRRFEEKN